MTDAELARVRSWAVSAVITDRFNPSYPERFLVSVDDSWTFTAGRATEMDVASVIPVADGQYASFRWTCRNEGAEAFIYGFRDTDVLLAIAPCFLCKTADCWVFTKEQVATSRGHLNTVTRKLTPYRLVTSGHTRTLVSESEWHTGPTR